MATSEVSRWDETSVGVLAGGSTVEAVGGAAALVLAILGLAAVLPETLAAVATIAIGVALLAEGTAIAARYAKILAGTELGRIGAAELGGGMSAEFLGGAAGIVLGLLALLGVASMTLEAVAAIVFGGALLFGSAATSKLDALASRSEARTAAREAVVAASGAEVMVGLGSAVLGILALVGLAPATLTLVALLGVGTAIVLSGTAITARMAALLHV
jgi:hypothetical protein